MTVLQGECQQSGLFPAQFGRAPIRMIFFEIYPPDVEMISKAKFLRHNEYLCARAFGGGNSQLYLKYAESLWWSVKFHGVA